MNAKMLGALVLLTIFPAGTEAHVSEPIHLDASNIDTEGRKVIEQIVAKVAASPEGASYLKYQSEGQFGLGVYPTMGPCVELSWRLRHDVADIPNPPYIQAVFHEEVTTDTGISLRVFIVAGTEKGMRKPQDKEWLISKNERVQIGYFLKTRTEDKALRSRLEAIISSAAKMLSKQE